MRGPAANVELRKRNYARGGGGSGLNEVSTRVASGFVPKSVVAMIATTALPGVRTAAGPNNEASVAVSPSLLLRHEQEAGDFDRV
jgi:hypothetical protein